MKAAAGIGTALLVTALAGCGPAGGDPLVGEYEVIDTAAVASGRPTESGRIRVTLRDGHYEVVLREDHWKDGGKPHWSQPIILTSCPPEVFGLLGERWQQFEPVGACTKGLFVFHTRATKVIPRMTTTGYVMFASWWGGGMAFELRKD